MLPYTSSLISSRDVAGAEAVHLGVGWATVQLFWTALEDQQRQGVSQEKEEQAFTGQLHISLILYH
jgi:hypothetical protein